MKSLKKLDNFIVSLDGYGTAVGVHYRGSSSYQTRLGALVSIVTFILMTANLINLTLAFFDGSMQVKTAQTLKYDTFGVKPYNLNEMRFEVQIIVDPPIPPRFGSFNFYQNEDHG